MPGSLGSLGRDVRPRQILGHRFGGPSLARPRSRIRAWAALAAVGLLAAGCLGAPPASSVPIPTSTLPPLTATPATSGVLRLAIPNDPGAFAPGATDPSAQLVDGFLFAALYRLDSHLVPQPDLALGAPSISTDRQTWTVRLRAGLRFSDGSLLTSTDVVRTYQLVLSADCPFGDLCRVARDALSSVSAKGANTVVFQLARPDAPLQAELLAQLGIMSGAAMDASLARLVDAAQSLDLTALTNLTDQIAQATNADACVSDQPPASCDLASYVSQLEDALRPSGITLPDPQLLLGPDGKPDASAYGAALFSDAQALGVALATSGTDRLAAAFPLLDLQTRPISSGPFQLDEYVPGQRLDLTRWGASPGAGAPSKIQFMVIGDPAVASTALQTGEVDWLPELDPSQVSTVAAQSGLRAATRPSGTYRELVFNVRPGHPYADPAARLAFATCLDRGGDLGAASAGAGSLAQGPVPPGSWAADADPGWPSYDPAAARAILAQAGWTVGSDGIMTKDGTQLRSQLYIRPAQTTLLAFATSAAAQLKGCGIDLQVIPEDPGGALLLAQLEYPNTFDTVLLTRTAGPDPDADLSLLSSAHITTVTDPADGNIGGWSDPTADSLIAEAAGNADRALRADAYQRLQALIAHSVPILPISWDLTAAAISNRVEMDGKPVDPGAAGYERDALGWRLAGP
jgi:ABC-type transport system substrate-binding protein